MTTARSKIMERRFYELGTVGFCTSGYGSLRQIVDHELRPILATNPLPLSSSLEFHFGNVHSQSSFTRFAKPVAAWENGFAVEASGFKYSVSIHKDLTRVNVEMLERKKTLRQKLRPEWLRRAKDWNYLSYEETVAKNFMYSLFNYTLQLHQISQGQTFAHASSFCNRDRGVAILAWGGIGKTTSMLKMVLEDNWKFLSDDFVTLDAEGSIWRSPMKMQIYAYNLVDQIGLSKAFMANRSAIDKMSWYWRKARYGHSSVRRRVAAEDLFGESGIGRSAILTDAIFAERTNQSEFTFIPVDPMEIANRSAAILMKEIEPFALIASAIHGTGNEKLFPTYRYVFEKSRANLMKGLSKAQNFLWCIPKSATPEEIHQDLRGRLGVRNGE